MFFHNVESGNSFTGIKWETLILFVTFKRFNRICNFQRRQTYLHNHKIFTITQSILYNILISRIFCRLYARLSAIIALRFLLKYITLSVYVAILLLLLSSSIRFVVYRNLRKKKLIAQSKFFLPISIITYRASSCIRWCPFTISRIAIGCSFK